MTINYVIVLNGMIVSILGVIQVLQNRFLKKQSRWYFLWIFCLLIAYAVSDLVSWLTHGTPGTGWILASKTGLFLESVFSCALIPLVSSSLLYTAGEGNGLRNRIQQFILVLFAAYLILLVYTQFSTTIYYYDELNIYHRGPWYPVLLVPPTLMSLLSLGLLFSRRDRLSRPQVAAFASCFLIPGVSMIIQMLLYGVSIIVLGASIAAFLCENKNIFRLLCKSSETAF